MSDVVKISELDFDVESLSNQGIEFEVSSEEETEFEPVAGVPIEVNTSYNLGEGLIRNEETNTVSVNIAKVVEDGNPNPVSSDAVHEAILGETYSILTSRKHLATNLDIDNLFK